MWLEVNSANGLRVEVTNGIQKTLSRTTGCGPPTIMRGKENFENTNSRELLHGKRSLHFVYYALFSPHLEPGKKTSPQCTGIVSSTIVMGSVAVDRHAMFREAHHLCQKRKGVEGRLIR